jgi:hypothetical protein
MVVCDFLALLAVKRLFCKIAKQPSGRWCNQGASLDKSAIKRLLQLCNGLQ